MSNDYCFTKCLKLLSTPMGKYFYDDKLRIQTFWEQGLGAKAGNAEFAGVDNAGVVKSAIWVVIIGYFNNRFMDFNRLFVAALMGNLNT